MQTFQALNMPHIHRDDVLNASQTDVREYWCVTGTLHFNLTTQIIRI